ncbi:MAG: hypothetical protein Q9170_001973 [Blastenia crenularia]
MEPVSCSCKARHQRLTSSAHMAIYPQVEEPDSRKALIILEELHSRLAAATPSRLESSRHCRYLYMIFVQDNGKEVPHSVFHETVGVLASFVTSSVLLKDLSEKKPVPPGLAAMVLHLEMLLGKFLEQIVVALHTKDNKYYNLYPFQGVEGRRRILVS